LGGCNIVAYTGSNGTGFNAIGGTDLASTTRYGADTIPQYALYKSWMTSPIGGATYEIKMSNLTSLVLPSTAQKIENYACSTMPSIANIDLSNMVSLKDIGNSVFYKCALVKKVIFPSSVESFGAKPFSMCAAIDTFTIPSSVSNILSSPNFFEGCTSLKAVIFEEPCNLTLLPPTMFASGAPELNPNNLKTITVPSCVTDIGTAFTNFKGTSIDCHSGNTVYTSSNGVLYLRSDNSIVAVPRGITSFTIPSTMTVIPDNLFERCTYLTNVTVESSLTKIGKRAFYYCPITNFNFPSTLVEIGDEAFSETSLVNVEFTNNAALTKIGNNVFALIDTLQSINLSGLSKMGDRMFRGSPHLNSVTLGNSITKIPISAFASCSSLATIALPNGIDTIGESAFDGCTLISSINMPTSLKYLGAYAFRGNTELSTINIPDGCVDIPDAGQGTAFANTYINVVVGAGNTKYASADGILLNKQKNKVLYIPNSKTAKSITIPEGVDTIVSMALYTNSNRMINKITLPSTLKFIMNYGLYGAHYVDTIVVKAATPPVCASAYYSLNNDYRYTPYPFVKRVIIPISTKSLYLNATGWKNYPENLYSMQAEFTDLDLGVANALSPNGKYVAGKSANDGYIYNLITSQIKTLPHTTNAFDVNDNQQAAVNFYDNNYTIDGTPIVNGGVWRNDSVYSVGLGRYGVTPSSREALSSCLSAIDANGNVYGMSFARESASKIFPFVWKWNGNDYITDTMAFASPANTGQGDQGARIYSVSSDGNTAAGWVSRLIYGGVRSAIGWTSPTEYKLFDENNQSEANGVSPNGKYIVTSKDSRASLYDVEKNKLTVFGPSGSSASAVSNNGFVVGFKSVSETGGRIAFIWSEKLGYMNFRQFIDKYLPNMQVPKVDNSDFFHFPTDGSIMDVPMDISADGLTICGWTGYNTLSRRGWAIQIPDTLDLVDRPHNLTAEVNVAKRNHVNLSWSTPTGYGTHTLDFYYIYRDDKFIGRIEAYEGTTYTDTNAPAGTVLYSVSAVYDYVNTTTYLESGMTDVVNAVVVDNYDIPFSENFESGSYETNYWTTESSLSNAWLMSEYSGLNGFEAAIFLCGGNQLPYNLSLTSKPFDATSKNKIILSYMHTIYSNIEEFLGLKDTVSIEVGIDTVWTKVSQIIVNKVYDWLPTTIDISNIAAGHLFRVRFRASSGANRNFYNFKMDEFGVSTEISAAPLDVIAHREASGAPVKVFYKDATGSYGMSYTGGKFIRGERVGNAGNPIIAANRYASQYLERMKGKYLTSITAFLFSDDAETVIPSELKLAVFVNGQRVEGSNITSFDGDRWNNFKLSTPIAITGTEEIFAGIEVASGDLYNRPLAIDYYPTNPDGNFYSEDNGATWQSAIDANIDGNWGIVANFRDESSAKEIDDDLFDVRYEIYRNGSKIKSLNYGQVYIDSAGTSDEDCYTVQVFRSTGGLSAISQEGCVDDNAAIEHVYNTRGGLVVYPNPTTNVANIAIDCKIVRVYDMLGKMVLQQYDSQVDMGGLQKGIYLFEVITTEGNTVNAKVVKR
jgi:hypothetical protein